MEDFSFALAQDEEAHVLLSGHDFVYAPVVQGQAAGYAYVCIGEEIIGKVPVIYENTVEIRKETKKYFWDGWFK